MSTKLPVVSGVKSPATLTPLQRYLHEIARYPLLNPEEEYELARQHMEDGDVTSAHRLITANLRLVVKIASDFRQTQVNLLDLIQEGNYGLMQAVKRFNPYKGVKLSSYAAWWIRAYILKHLLDNKSQVRLATTAAQRKLFYNLRKETDKLLAEYESADPKMIAARLNVPERDVLEMQKRLGSSDVSLDAPAYADDGGNGPAHGELIAANDRQAIDELLADRQVRQIFERHLEEFRESLTGRDREVFELRLLSDQPLTLQEVGDRYGITRERARQIEARIIKNLQKFVREKGTLDI